MSNATFAAADLTTFCGLDELGLQATAQRVEVDRAGLACKVVKPDDWCRRCGQQGTARGTVIRRLAHIPLGWRPTTLDVRVRRYWCPDCAHVWRQDTICAAGPRTKISRSGLRWALEVLVVQHLTIARIAASLAVRWNTANTAVLTEGKRLLINEPTRFNGVTRIGVEEHVWRHTRYGEKYVTVIIDLTPIRDKTGPARLLDMVEDRSKAVFKTWLNSQSKQFREQIQDVAMNGISGFKTATTEELPAAVAVMDPFHVVRLAGDGLDRSRQRVQQSTLGHRGRARDPLYTARRVLHTGDGLLTEKQRAQLEALFTGDDHIEVEATLGIHQRIVAAYREPEKARVKQMMEAVMDSIATGVPT